VKIIQTYWEKDTDADLSSEKENRFNGGWLSRKYLCMGLALSCLKFRQHYDHVEFYTNSRGYQLLINELNLPYTKVHLTHDNINNISPLLWAVPKLYTYSLQDEPFIHADCDVFIWEKFPEALERAPLIAQHEEKNLKFYKEPLLYLNKAISDLRPELCYNPSANGELLSVNAGIFGGNDIEFIKTYSLSALAFIKKYMNDILGFGAPATLNAVLEQYLFYQMAFARSKPVDFMFDHVSENFREVMRLEHVPHCSSFVHLFGSAKRDILSCSIVGNFLKREFSEYHALISSKFSAGLSPLAENHFQYVASFPLTRKIINALLVVRQDRYWDEDFVVSRIRKINSLPVSENIKKILTSVFEFEVQKNVFRSDKNDTYNEEYDYQCFSEAKDFLAKENSQGVLNTSYELGGPYRVLEFDYDVSFLSSSDVLLQNLLRNPDSIILQKHYVLLTRKRDGILVTDLKNEQHHLKMFLKGKLNGNEIASYFAQISPDGDNIEEKSRRRALDFISMGLTFYGTLRICPIPN